MNLETIVKVNDGQMSAEIGGESVILQLERGNYYGLKGVGELVWGAIQTEQKLELVRDQIMAEYDVSEAQCTADLLALCQKLLKAGLIKIVV